METVKRNSLYAWLLASRPKTLTGAVGPVIVGTALAVADGCFQWLPALVCCLFACLMQIAANFINDLFDYLKGTDRADRLGPERACAQGWISPDAMKTGIGVTICLACLIGCIVLFYAGWELVLVGIVCVIFAFLYTTRLSYLGWGDALVVVFFGFVPVGGTYYVQAHTVTPDVAVAALICGLVTDTLLVVNNYRDREQDALSGKRTLIVRWGEPFGRYLYLSLGVVAWLLSFWLLAVDVLSPLSFLCSSCVYLGFHVVTWRKMVAIRSGKKLNGILGATSRNMLLMGLLLSLGICLHGIFGI